MILTISVQCFQVSNRSLAKVVSGFKSLRITNVDYLCRMTGGLPELDEIVTTNQLTLKSHLTVST